MSNNEKVEYAKKVAQIFDTLEKADVSISDMHRITGISRETLHRWKSGRPVADKLRLNMAYGVASRIATLVAIKSLPLQDAKPAERAGKIRDMIAELNKKTA